MNNNPIKVLFVYDSKDARLRQGWYASTFFNFYRKALNRNNDIKVTYQADTIQNIKAFDVLLLSQHQPLKNDPGIPVFGEMRDPHSRPKLDSDKYVSCFFGHFPEAYVKRYFPEKEFKYKVLMSGIEPSLYQNITPFEKRIKKKILNSGNADYPSFRNTVRRILGKPKIRPSFRHYKLRSLCNYLRYVEYVNPSKLKYLDEYKPEALNKYVGDRYPELLQKYRASIAATTEFPTRKYFEIPAAGCLTFMEITEKNFGSHIGFTDGVNAIFINEDNYKDKFEEYLSDIDNPKWEKIASAGREYAMNNFNDDLAVKKLVELMREALE